MRFSILFLCFFSLGYSAFGQNDTLNQDYDALFRRLLYNHVIHLESGDTEEKMYLDFLKISKSEHLRRLNIYNETLKSILDADKDVLNYLVSFKRDEKQSYSNWIWTVNPLISNRTGLSLSKSQASLILMDYYLMGGKTSLPRPPYLRSDHLGSYEPLFCNRIKYRRVTKFLKQNAHLNKTELREEYRKWIAKELS